MELDDLAVRQGEEEARRHQSLIEEIEELRAQLAVARRTDSHGDAEGQRNVLFLHKFNDFKKNLNAIYEWSKFRAV